MRGAAMILYKSLSIVLTVSVAIAPHCAMRAGADDWPTYRHDHRRSGVTDEKLTLPLCEAWSFRPRFAPRHAWGDPQPKPIETHLELPRVRFDDAFQVAAADGRVFFGSSSDNAVYALDAAGGELLWRFHTEGPVRCAPTVAKGKVYVGSDDGHVFCLAAKSGKLAWKFRAAPSPERVLGNGRLISLWPVRTGVLVEDGTAYFGAGVFPAEGLYLYAVNARSGKLLWKNDSYGRGGLGTVSPQGHMLLSDDKVFVPSARTMPAAFDRATGQFLYHRNFSWRGIGLFGGTHNLLASNLVLTATEQIVCARQKDGEYAFGDRLPAGLPTDGSRRIAVDGQRLFTLTGEQLLAIDFRKWLAEQDQRIRLSGLKTRKINAENRIKWSREYLENRGRQEAGMTDEEKEHAAEHAKRVRERLAKAKEELKAVTAELAEEEESGAVVWKTPCEDTGAIVLTPGHVFVGGKTVAAFRRKNGKETWSAPAKGTVRGMAVADGRLIASTDTGFISSFMTAPGPAKPRDLHLYHNVKPKHPPVAGTMEHVDFSLNPDCPKRGYAVFMGSSLTAFAKSIAYGTDLMVTIVVDDPKEAARMRNELDWAEVLGGKAVVVQEPLDRLAFPSYMADMVVCDNASLRKMPAHELLRIIKPCGGAASLQKPSAEWLNDFRAALRDSNDTETSTKRNGDWVVVKRGSLPGAGSWTHQYGDANNTGCSDDYRVRGPLGILWFGLPGPGRMPSRHASTAAPLAAKGRMFVQGENVVMAHDSYNGVQIWQRDIPGATRLQIQGGAPSNLATDGNSLFLVVRNRCMRLDAATGKTLKTYPIPVPRKNKPAMWNYLACVDGVLYGSRSLRAVWAGHSDDELFAIDVESGRTLWSHSASRVIPSTICIDNGLMFFVDRTVTDQRCDQAMTGLEHKPRLDKRGKPLPPDVRLVVCLNAKTGKKKWEKPQYVGDCVEIGKGGGDLAAMCAKGVLLLCGQPWNGHFWRDFLAGKFSRRSLLAFDTTTGEMIWSGHKGYRSRPIIVGNRIVAEPWAHDLKTGEELMRTNPFTGAQARWQVSRPGHHCGNVAGSPHMLFFRSASTAYYDLLEDYGTAHFGAQRPGCWINFIPANGLLMIPEASSGCICPYSLHCTVVLHPRERNRVWGVYSTPGDTIPVKTLRVNFGAPGDRKDDNGNIWLAWPRRYRGRLVTNPGVDTPNLRTATFFDGDADFAPFNASPAPWVYLSGWTGVTNFTVALHDNPDAFGEYDLRFHFAADPYGSADGAVFDVTAEGKAVLHKVKAPCAGNRLVREVKGLRSDNKLDVSFMPRKNGTTVLSGLEISRRAVRPHVRDLVLDITEGKTAELTLPVTFRDGTPMAVDTTVEKAPDNGTLEHKSGACYAYTPDKHYIGADSFRWSTVGERPWHKVLRTTLRVRPDTNAPVIAGIAERGTDNKIIVTFDEPLEPDSATEAANYALDGGATIKLAALMDSARAVTLTTSPLEEGQSYKLSVSGIRDTARTPNTIAAGSSGKFAHTLTGYIQRQVWEDIDGNEILDLTSHPNFPAKPTRVDTLTSFDAPVNWGSRYGTRIHGYLRPTRTGKYTFWIAGDDSCELRLSSDDSPANKKTIARVPGWTRRLEWEKFPVQRSTKIELIAGKPYYIEALQKEHGGGDHLSVAWEGPEIERRLIDGAYLLLPKSE